MQVEQRSIDLLTPYDRNPRKMAEPAIAKLATFIEKFGWRQPIVIDRDGVIVVGTRRYWAAKRLGLDEVPVHVATDLTPELCKEYRLADNKLAEDGEWDDTLLVAELLDLADLGIDISALGFDPFEDKAEEPGEAEEPAPGVGDRLHHNQMVNAVFYMSDIRTLEAALLQTGEKNRAKALAAICQAYVSEDPLAAPPLEGLNLCL